MIYIKKYIDFDQWYDLNDNDNYLFNENYVLKQLNKYHNNKNKNNNYFILKNFLLKKNIFNKFFNNLFKDKLTDRFTWYNHLITDNKNYDINLTKENKVIYFLKTNLKIDLIDLSFDWDLSNEGYNYWLLIKNEFFRIL